MKEKATFLSYISAEKRLRKEQLKKNSTSKSTSQPHAGDNATSERSAVKQNSTN